MSSDGDNQQDPLAHQDLLVWADVLEFYGRDWDTTFDRRPSYFTQEFWYLLVLCTRAYWQGEPMNVGAACQAMKTGSSRTREARINTAVDDGFLVKAKSSQDARSTVLKPSPLLEAKIKGHLQRTLAHARGKLLRKDA